MCIKIGGENNTVIGYLKKVSEDKNKKIYIFGAGTDGKNVGSCFSMLGIIIDGYFDNAFPDGGISTEGIVVLPLQMLRDCKSKDKVVVYIASYAVSEISKQLAEYGIENIIDKRKLAITYNEKYEKIVFQRYKTPIVSVLLTACNSWEYTYNCLKSLKENHNKASFEIILGDDCSTDLTKNAEMYIEGIKIVHFTEKQNYLRNVNKISKYARGKYIMLLGNDTKFIKNGYIDILLNYLENDEKIAAITGKYWIPMRNEYDYAQNYSNEVDRVTINGTKLQNVEYIWPVATLYRQSVWQKIGGYDEIYLPVYWEDCDLNLRIIESGYDCVYVPYAELVHYHGVSYLFDDYKEAFYKNEQIFKERWSHYFSNIEKRKLYLSKR